MRDGFIQQQARRLLENDRYALLAVLVFMFLPYTTWVSMTVLSLVTLRKGWKQGAMLLLPALTAHVIATLTSVIWSVALIDAVVRILPCYFAACLLRTTSSWKVVSASFLCLVVIGAALLQWFLPDLIDAQYAYLQAAIREIDSGRTLLGFWDERGIESFVVANYLLGFQALCLFIAIISPLMFARSLQAQLFYPGGFRQEMLNFRGDKQSVIVLSLLCFAAYQNRLLAMNILPLIVFCFTLAGLSFSANVLFNKMKPFKAGVMLLTPLMLLPLMMLPFYAVLGAFDGLFNFRLYLSSNTGKTT